MARAKKKTAPKKKSSRSKKKTRFFGFKTFAVLVLLAAAAVFLYVRSGGTLKELERFLPQELRLENPDKQQGSFEADIFFGDTDTDLLITEKRTLPWNDDPEKRARLLMAELLKGPTGDAVRTTPESTVLRSVSVTRDGIARVDLSASLTREHPGGSSSEMLTLYSIVNTLAFNIDDIHRVQILIEGRTIDTLAGHMDCRQPVVPNIKIIK
jgi:spore germination protein GerM